MKTWSSQQSLSLNAGAVNLSPVGPPAAAVQAVDLMVHAEGQGGERTEGLVRPLRRVEHRQAPK